MVNSMASWYYSTFIYCGLPNLSAVDRNFANFCQVSYIVTIVSCIRIVIFSPNLLWCIFSNVPKSKENKAMFPHIVIIQLLLFHLSALCSILKHISCVLSFYLLMFQYVSVIRTFKKATVPLCDLTKLLPLP